MSAGDAFTHVAIIFIVALAVIASVALAVFFFIIPKCFELMDLYKRKKVIKRIIEPQDVLTDDVEEILKQQEEDIKREHDETISLIMTYTQGTFIKILSADQLERLKSNIIILESGKGTYESVEERKLDYVTPVDLYHYGWNIGKRLIGKDNTRKFGPTVASFLQESFPITLGTQLITTIATKLSTDDGKYTLKKIKPYEELIPHVFPGSENIQLPDRKNEPK